MVEECRSRKNIARTFQFRFTGRDDGFAFSELSIFAQFRQSPLLREGKQQGSERARVINSERARVNKKVRDKAPHPSPLPGERELVRNVLFSRFEGRLTLFQRHANAVFREHGHFGTHLVSIIFSQRHVETLADCGHDHH